MGILIFMVTSLFVSTFVGLTFILTTRSTQRSANLLTSKLRQNEEFISHLRTIRTMNNFNRFSCEVTEDGGQVREFLQDCFLTTVQIGAEFLTLEISRIENGYQSSPWIQMTYDVNSRAPLSSTAQFDRLISFELEQRMVRNFLLWFPEQQWLLPVTKTPESGTHEQTSIAIEKTIIAIKERARSFSHRRDFYAKLSTLLLRCQALAPSLSNEEPETRHQFSRLVEQDLADLVDRYAALPPAVQAKMQPHVLGSLAKVSNTLNAYEQRQVRNAERALEHSVRLIEKRHKDS